jgi:fructosamine-3-kinase
MSSIAGMDRSDDPWRRTVTDRLGVVCTGAAVVGEGMTSRVERWTLADGGTLIAKRPKIPPRPGLYASEAHGLAALSGTPGLTVPQVVHHDHAGIVLSDCGAQAAAPVADDDPYWERLGRGVAHLHGRIHGHFGWHRPTFWGVLPMAQTPTADGVAFYRDQRFHWFLDQPPVRAGLPPALWRGVAALADDLGRRIPAQPPCLNHGDLWYENRLRGPAGEAVVIDPFVHAGWAEADLSHAWIFGGFPPRSWDAYRECHPLDPCWPDRLRLLGLIHMLAIVREIGPDPWTVRWIAATVEDLR